MRILFIGDIVGKSGRDIVSSLLYSLKKEYDIDLVIANAENSAHGKGITIRIYRQLMDAGIDYITMGNHTYSKAEINKYMEEMNRIIVPYNHSMRSSDNYYKIIEYKGLKICLTNILGTVLIPETSIDQYTSFNHVIEETASLNPDFYFVDFHAETTAEKRLFAEYFSNYAKVVVGTHTHVQTADEDLINGCAFISDVGMCGAYESIIGRDIDETIRANIDNEKTVYTIAEGPAVFCAVIIDIDENKRIPTGISRIQIRP